jgi:HPt (histidine-containing phosphotransfer) domain-containing protein
MNAPDPIAGLRSRFVARSADDMAALRGHFGGAPLDAASLRLIVHRLSGAAGTFGYAEVSDAAGEADDALLERPDQTDDALVRLIQALERMVASGA